MRFQVQNPAPTGRGGILTPVPEAGIRTGSGSNATEPPTDRRFLILPGMIHSVSMKNRDVNGPPDDVSPPGLPAVISGQIDPAQAFAIDDVDPSLIPGKLLPGVR